MFDMFQLFSVVVRNSNFVRKVSFLSDEHLLDSIRRRVKEQRDGAESMFSSLVSFELT